MRNSVKQGKYGFSETVKVVEQYFYTKLNPEKVWEDFDKIPKIPEIYKMCNVCNV